MARPLVGRAVLTELREYFVREHVLRTISDAFEDQGIELNPEVAPQVSGERRQMVEEYYASLDLSDAADIRRLLGVIEREIARCRPAAGQLEQNPIGSVIIALQQDGYQLDGYRIVPTTSTPLRSLRHHLQAISSQSITDDWERMLASADTDPEDAITAARALVESTCKCILDERKISYEDRWDLQRLYKETVRVLQLSPEGQKEQVFRQILGGLLSVSAGLAEVRNAFGDAHGKGRQPVRATPRHARLAVNSAGTLAVFLLETLEARQREGGSDR